jgi:prophage regulatory protein
MAITLLKINEVSTRLRFCRAQIYKMIQRGDFPPPVKLSKRSSVWPEDVVEDWLQSRIEQSRERIS